MIIGALLVSTLWLKTATNDAKNSQWFPRSSSSTQTKEHELSGGVVFAVVMFAFATDLLSSPVQQRSGAFIGYAQDGSPRFNIAHERSQSILLLIRTSLRDILAETDSRQIFYFLCINLVSFP